MVTYTQEELDAECKRHFQMGISSAKADSRVNHLKSQLRNVERMNANLIKKVSSFEEAAGCEIGVFKDKNAISLLKYLLSLKGDSLTKKQIVATAEAVKDASKQIEGLVETIALSAGVRVGNYDEYDEWHDY